MARNNQMIAAYGEADDRLRLRAVAEAAGVSQSSWVISRIREAHLELVGSDKPLVSSELGVS